MEEADDLGEKRGAVGLDVPLLLEEVAVEDRIGPDDAMEKPALVRFVKVLDCRA